MLDNIRADFRRYPGGGLHRFLVAALSQGFWAVVSYRVGHRLQLLPEPVRTIAMLVWLPIAKIVECATGIAIGFGARIGPGLYIGHFGGIIVSGRAVIGAECNLSHGVTIGVAGRGDKRGVPVIGDRVYIGPGAKVFGPVTVGDDSAVGANAVVVSDVPQGVSVGGIPARIISHHGSTGMIEITS